MRATLGLEENDTHSITVDELMPNIDYFLAEVGSVSVTLLVELT